MKVIKNYIYNMGYQFLTMLLPLITGPYISRVLGPKGVGINTYTYTIANWFVLLGSVGVAFYGNRQIAYVRKDSKKLSLNFWEIFIMKLITIIIALIIFIVYISTIGIYKEYQLVQASYVIAAALDISWFFMGIENFKITVTRNTVVKITSLILIILFVKSENDLLIYITILALSTLIGNLTLWPYIKEYLVKISIKELRPFRHLKDSLILFLPLAAIQIYANLNKIMLGIFDTTTSSGFYDKSDVIVKMVLTIGTSLVTVLVPRASQIFAEGKMDEVKKILYKSFSFISFISVPLWLGLASISLKFGAFFYGKDFQIVGKAMFIESILIVIISWASVVGNQYLVPTNQTKEYTKSIFIGAFVNIVLNIPLIKVFGLYGAIVSTVLSEASVTFYQLYSLRDQIDYRKIFADLKKVMLSGLVMFVVVLPLNICIKLNIITLLIEISVGVVVYTCMTHYLKLPIVKDIENLILKKKY